MCVYVWASNILTFHYLLYPVWLCMWQIIKNLEPWTLNLEYMCVPLSALGSCSWLQCLSHPHSQPLRVTNGPSSPLCLTPGGYFFILCQPGWSNTSLTSPANEVADAGSFLSILSFRLFLCLNTRANPMLAASQLAVCSSRIRWNQVQLAESDGNAI